MFDCPATLFREVKCGSGVLKLLLAGGVFALMLCVGLYRVPGGREPTLWPLLMGFGVAMAGFILALRMTVVATRQNFMVRYFPLPFG